ncbi:MAG: hypothetical protein WC897_05245 [Candidatus Gracilibacteria bacterium]
MGEIQKDNAPLQNLREYEDLASKINTSGKRYAPEFLQHYEDVNPKGYAELVDAVQNDKKKVIAESRKSLDGLLASLSLENTSKSSEKEPGTLLNEILDVWPTDTEWISFLQDVRGNGLPSRSIYELWDKQDDRNQATKILAHTGNSITQFEDEYGANPQTFAEPVRWLKMVMRKLKRKKLVNNAHAIVAEKKMSEQVISTAPKPVTVRLMDPNRPLEKSLTLEEGLKRGLIYQDLSDDQYYPTYGHYWLYPNSKDNYAVGRKNNIKPGADIDDPDREEGVIPARDAEESRDIVKEKAINRPENFAKVLKANPTKYLNPAVAGDLIGKEFTIKIDESDRDGYEYSRIEQFVGPKGQSLIELEHPEEYQLKTKVDGKEVVCAWEDGSWWYDKISDLGVKTHKRLLVEYGETKFKVEKKSVEVVKVVETKEPAETVVAVVPPPSAVAVVEEGEMDPGLSKKEIEEIAKLSTEFYDVSGVDVIRKIKALKKAWPRYYKEKGASTLKNSDEVFANLMGQETALIEDIEKFTTKLGKISVTTNAGKKSLAKLKEHSGRALVALQTHKKAQVLNKDVMVAIKTPPRNGSSVEGTA